MSIFLEDLYKGEEIQKIEKFQRFLKEKNKKLINLLFEIIFEKKYGLNLVKKARNIKNEIYKEYNKELNNLLQLNQRIFSILTSYLKEEKINYLKIENRVKKIDSLIEKMYRGVVGTVYDIYKQNMINDLFAYRIITENNKNTFEVLEKISSVVLNSIYPLEFYYKNPNPLIMELEDKAYKIATISFDGLKNNNKVLLYKFSKVTKENYKTFKKTFNKFYYQKEINIRKNDEMSDIPIEKGKIYIVGQPFIREAVLFYDYKNYNLYLLLTNIAITPHLYNQFRKLMRKIKEKGFDKINKISLGKEFIGRVSHRLYKVDYILFFEPMGFKLKKIIPYAYTDFYNKLKLNGKGIIGKLEMCSYDIECYPFIEIQVLDYNTHNFREKSSYYKHQNYRKRRVRDIFDKINKICKDFNLDENRKKRIKEITKIFLPNL